MAFICMNESGCKTCGSYRMDPESKEYCCWALEDGRKIIDPDECDPEDEYDCYGALVITPEVISNLCIEINKK